MLEANPGVKAHETMLNHLINAAVVDKDYQSAAVILAQMWEKGVPMLGYLLSCF